MSDQVRASHILINHADAPQANTQLSAEDAMNQIRRETMPSRSRSVQESSSLSF